MYLPYIANLKEPMTVRYDGPNGRSRVDFYNGMDYSIYRNDIPRSTRFEIFMQQDKYGCYAFYNNPGTNYSLPTMLPDVREPGWMYIGITFLSNIRVHQWLFVEDHGSKSNVYTFSVNMDQDLPFPVQYNMTGINAFNGGHRDVYIVEYNQLIPMTFTADDFAPDPSCSSASATPSRQQTGVSSTSYLIDMLPSSTQGARGPHHAFDQHKKRHGRQYEDAEHEHRHAVLLKNLQFIHAHNAKHSSYQMHVNMFADMEMHELQGTRFAARKGMYNTSDAAPSMFHHDGTAIPDSVDWCARGKCTAVKDQAFCGSCWAFATTTSIESAYAVKYNDLVTLSPQQVVDCTWYTSGRLSNFGCLGGLFPSAVDSLVDQNMGLMLDSAYPYIGQDGRCAYDASQFNVKVTGYSSLTPGDEQLLVEAIAQQPVAIAIEITPSLLYYANGIYHGEDCRSQHPPNVNILDHAVVAVGYTDAAILVRNSWSTYWGDNGFITIARGNNTCGIATYVNTVTVK
jgi:C1A family cysteine protease